MKILKYFRRRNAIFFDILKKVDELQLPLDYLGFILRFRPHAITPIITNKPHRIGVVLNHRCSPVHFLEYNDLWVYEPVINGEVLKSDLIKIADNNIPEGGVFLHRRIGNIYWFEMEPLLIDQTEWTPVFSSFSELIMQMHLYFESDEGWVIGDIEINEDIGQLRFPWENE